MVIGIEQALQRVEESIQNTTVITPGQGGGGNPNAVYVGVDGNLKTESTSSPTITDKLNLLADKLENTTPGGGSVILSPINVQIDGRSITTDGVANIPIASSNLGVIKITGNNGLGINSSGEPYITEPTNTILQNRDSIGSEHQPITVSTIDQSVKLVLTNSNVEWTDDDKAAAKLLLGIGASEGNSIDLDATLTKSGFAADSKSVGDAISTINTSLSSKYSKPSGGIPASDLASGVLPTIPTSLPTPNKLTFTGASTGEFNGSSSLTINIPAQIENAELTTNRLDTISSSNKTSTSKYPSINGLGSYISQYGTIGTSLTDAEKATAKTNLGIETLDVQINGITIKNNGVANIPISSNSTLGLIKAGEGIIVEGSTGVANLNWAYIADITSRNVVKVLRASNINDIVKSALTDTNKLQLTDDEKATACETLGVQNSLNKGVKKFDGETFISLIEGSSNVEAGTMLMTYFFGGDGLSKNIEEPIYLSGVDSFTDGETTHKDFKYEFDGYNSSEIGDTIQHQFNFIGRHETIQLTAITSKESTDVCTGASWRFIQVGNGFYYQS